MVDYKSSQIYLDLEQFKVHPGIFSENSDKFPISFAFLNFQDFKRLYRALMSFEIIRDQEILKVYIFYEE